MSFKSFRWFILALGLGAATAAQAQTGRSTVAVAPLASAPQVVVPADAWFTDLAAAQARARATNRPLVAVFSGSDWCKPCVTYEQEVFSQPAFAAYAKDRLVLAHFDFPRLPQHQLPAAQAKLNDTAKAQLNREGDFPLAVIVLPNGEILAKTGYISGGPAAFEAYLKKLLPTL
jgi:uncharacterized protein YyaL (SSP411 family)